MLDEIAEPPDAVLSNKRIRIFRARKQPGLEDAERRRLLGSAYAVNRSSHSLPSRRVVVECEHDGIEAKPLQSCDRARLEAGAARSRDRQLVVPLGEEAWREAFGLAGSLGLSGSLVLTPRAEGVVVAVRSVLNPDKLAQVPRRS